jgi:quinol monooxygenase YgiN
MPHATPASWNAKCLYLAAMVRLSVGLEVGFGESSEQMLDALRFLVQATRFETGCLGCSAWAESDSTVHYFEEWETEADMRRRVCSPRFTSLLAVIETARQTPHLQFEFIASTRALDYIAEVREITTPAAGD